MPKQLIDTTTDQGNGHKGDPLLTISTKINSNFNELYPAALPSTTAEKTAARAMFGLGTAATRPAQTSATDTTTGALVTTEGARYAALANYGTYYSGSAGKNIDTMVGGESGLFATSNPGTFPPGLGSFVYVNTQQTYTGGSSLQEACDYAAGVQPTGRRAFRVRSNTASEWSPWRVYLHTGNILGTVSQSAGVPTGAIIETGTNSNGRYTKFASGLLVCEHSLGMNASSDVDWTFPAAFLTTPLVSGICRSADRVLTHGDTPPNAISAGSLRGWAVTNGARTSAGFQLAAIGRWY